MKIFEVQMITSYIKTNWVLLILPSVLSIVLWGIYKWDKKKFSDIDKKVTRFGNKILLIAVLAIMSVILLNVKNALTVVVIMVITGELINIVLIPIQSVELQDNKRPKYWRIVKEEYKKCFSQKKLHHKNIMEGRDVQIEKKEYERKEEIIGCATVTIILLAIYSHFIKEKEFTYVFLSYLTGKFMWLDGGIIEGLSNIVYYFKKELSTAVALVAIWCVYRLVIEKHNWDIDALCIGLIPVFIVAIVLLCKYRKKQHVRKTQ